MVTNLVRSLKQGSRLVWSPSSQSKHLRELPGLSSCTNSSPSHGGFTPQSDWLPWEEIRSA